MGKKLFGQAFWASFLGKRWQRLLAKRLGGVGCGSAEGLGW